MKIRALVGVCAGAAMALSCARSVEPAPAPAANAREPARAAPARDPVDDAVQSARRKLKSGDEAGFIAALDDVRAHLPDGDPRKHDLGCEIATVFNNRGAQQLAKDPRGALIDARRAATLCGDDAMIRGNLVRVLVSQALAEDRSSTDGRARARDWLSEAVALDPRSVPAQRSLGEVLVVDEDFAGALVHLRAALALTPDDAKLRARIAEIEKKAAVEGSFRDARHNHFTARFEGYAEEQLSWTALDLLDKAYFSIGATLDTYPTEPITVVIYTGDQYKQATDAPDWSAGIYDGTIRVREGNIVAASGALEGLLRHEYTHAVLATWKTPLPAWFNEGLAMYFEGTGDAAAQICARAKRDGTLTSFADLDKPSLIGMSDNDAARTAYAMSATVVRALVDRRGEYALQSLASRLKAGESFANAFNETYATSPRAFVDAWVESL